MPVYNEVNDIQLAVEDVQREIFPVVLDTTLVIVDDGSTDGTSDILDRLAKNDSRVRVIHQANGGHGAALIAGLDSADSDVVLLIDSDRQIPLDSFAEFWTQIVTHDAVFGVRRHRDDPRSRLLLTALVRSTICILFGVRLADANAPFKIIRKSIWERLRPQIPDDTLAPSLFLAIYAQQQRVSLLEIDVSHRRRVHGSSKIRYFKLLRFCLRAFVQLLSFSAHLTL